MRKQVNQSRRHFIKQSITSTGGLALGFFIQTSTEANTSTATQKSFIPNIWLEIESNGLITIILTQSEMGQGVMTSLPMLVAEELDANWEDVQVKQAPVDPVYGWQGTGGSRSIRKGWEPLRKAGATARAMLIAAASKKWGVDRKHCKPENSYVFNKLSGIKISYAELVPEAIKEPLPDKVTLKNPNDFQLIGKPIPRSDIPTKVNGKAMFGIDVSVPNMLYASIIHCPVFNGKFISYNKAITKQIPKIKHVILLENAVTIIASDYWSTVQARDKINIEWDYGEFASRNSKTIHNDFIKAKNKPGKIHRDDGENDDFLRNNKQAITSVYETPYQAHATPEPMCCTASVANGKCEVWVPTQQPTGAFKTASKITGYADENIKIHTTLLGGGFGRRNIQDFVTQAVQLSLKTGKPIKLIWTREEDIQHDYYNPATYHQLSALLGTDGLPTNWYHKLIGTNYSHGALDLPYNISNLRMESVDVRTGIPLGPWRSVSYSYNVFATECFIDELAVKAKEDPVTYRLKLLKDVPRLSKVLEVAASKAKWNSKSRPNIHQGVAITASFGSYVAQVADIIIDKNKLPQVKKITCAVDCGTIVNPDTVIAQIESAIVYGLTATVKSCVTIKNGRVEQSNFHDFHLLRYDEMPEVEVHLIKNQYPPGGIGEPGLPPVAPAVVNAYFQATGKRVRKLPIT